MKSVLFLANKMFRAERGPEASRLLRLSLLGVALSVSVVLISLSIILGFKGQVKELAYQQTGHISLYHIGETWLGTSRFIHLTPETKSYLLEQNEIVAAHPLVQQMAMLKTDTDFVGFMLYGVDADYPLPVRTKTLANSRDSLYSLAYDEDSGNPIVLPEIIARRMNLELNDKINLYFTTQSKLKVRTFYLAATYETAGLDKMPAYCSASLLQKLLGIDEEAYSRIVLRCKSNQPTSALAQSLFERFASEASVEMNDYVMSTAEEMLPELFSWLDLLDSNVVFLIVVIILISVFTISTGIIILVLDKTRHIGILMSLGGHTSLLQGVFALVAIRLIAWGLLWGNLIAISLLYIQKRWTILKLDPRDYFIDSVPVSLQVDMFIWVNLTALLIVLLAIVLPLRLIKGIRPSRAIRFD